MKTVLAVLVVVACAQGAQLPKSFKKCDRKTSEAQCFKEAAQTTVAQMVKAFPEINLPSLEPLEITQLNIGAGSQGVVNVDQNFKNCKLYGLSGGKFDDFGFNFEEKYLRGSGVIPNLKKVCEYDLNGRILLLPVVGTGQSTINLKNVKITARFDYEEVKKRDKTYMKFNKQELSFDPESISFNFENLLGDKAIGDNVNKVLNENDKEVFGDVRKGYEEGIGLVLLQLLNNMFSKVSMEEMFN